VIIFAVVLGGQRADVVLIAAALGGDAVKARRLAVRLLPVIIAHIRRALRVITASDQVHEIAQEVWVELMKDDGRFLRAYAPERGASLEHYVGLIARRTAGNQQRKGRAERRGGHVVVVEFDPARDGSHRASPEAATVAHELAAGLETHLRQVLSARGRLVYRYLYTDQSSADDTAAATGLTKQAVYNWQHRIRARAREYLAAHG
jgi:RNA polymerase sigma factor (sigma-70 family)